MVVSNKTAPEHASRACMDCLYAINADATYGHEKLLVARRFSFRSFCLYHSNGNLLRVEDKEEEEFEPLFDYSRSTAPPPLFLDAISRLPADDSDEDDVIITSAPKRRSGSVPAKVTDETPASTPQKAFSKEIVNLDDDDWLNSPPKLPKLTVPVLSTGDHRVQQLRLKRAELMYLETQASPGAIRTIEEVARMQVQHSRQEEAPVVTCTPQRLKLHMKSPEDEPVANREKILLKVQNKSGVLHSIRIYLTDKFEKLFSTYAKMVGVSLSGLRFRFDGDQLSPNSTPKEQDMENDDIIEVYDSSP